MIVSIDERNQVMIKLSRRSDFDHCIDAGKEPKEGRGGNLREGKRCYPGSRRRLFSREGKPVGSERGGEGRQMNNEAANSTENTSRDGTCYRRVDNGWLGRIERKR